MSIARFKKVHVEKQTFFTHLFDKYTHSAVRSFFHVQLFIFACLMTTGLYLRANPTPAAPGIIMPVEEAQVQGVAVTQPILSATPASPPVPGDEPLGAAPATPTPPSVRLSKKSYTIAIVGDSMIDTMGERLEYLEHALTKRYPENIFFLYNYGTGAENVAQGFARMDKSFKYQDRSYPPVTQLETDIIIVGSWAYNPFFPHDRDNHWLRLTDVVHEAQRTDAKVYMLAEIAPLRRDFGKGPGGVNYSDNTAVEHSRHIIEQLENVLGLSKTLRVPVINVFEKSIANQSTKEGKREYVNAHDGIHPSVKGHEFTADVIVDSLDLR